MLLKVVAMKLIYELLELKRDDSKAMPRWKWNQCFCRAYDNDTSNEVFGPDDGIDREVGRTVSGFCPFRTCNSFRSS
jgi:hypothetical protein